MAGRSGPEQRHASGVRRTRSTAGLRGPRRDGIREPGRGREPRPGHRPGRRGPRLVERPQQERPTRRAPVARQARGGRSRPKKATLGSTSYDGVERETFEPDWGGANWYGTTSGTYWTINPKEYADPRKHGPEYQARARRAARTGADGGDDPVAPEAPVPGAAVPGAAEPGAAAPALHRPIPLLGLTSRATRPRHGGIPHPARELRPATSPRSQRVRRHGPARAPRRPGRPPRRRSSRRPRSVASARR